MSLAIDLLIVSGKNTYDNVEIASTMGLVAFSLMLVVAAFEIPRREGDDPARGDLRQQDAQPHRVVEVALAILIARGGALTSLLGTAGLTGAQWLSGALPAAVLFVLWELGKLLARRRTGSVAEPAPAAVRTGAATA